MNAVLITTIHPIGCAFLVQLRGYRTNDCLRQSITCILHYTVYRLLATTNAARTKHLFMEAHKVTAHNHPILLSTPTTLSRDDPDLCPSHGTQELVSERRNTKILKTMRILLAHHTRENSTQAAPFVASHGHAIFSRCANAQISSQRRRTTKVTEILAASTRALYWSLATVLAFLKAVPPVSSARGVRKELFQ